MSLDNNDILIRIRYALNLKDAKMVEVFELGGVNLTMEEVLKLLIKSKDSYDEDTNDDQIKCNNKMLESFLNGLITYKRGKQEPKPGQTEQPALLTKGNANINNVLLKKLKIALSLTSEEMLEIFQIAGVTVTKGELSGLLRKEGHKNYKECGDQFARDFLRGLALKLRS
ncbi:DUF1456 family protein [Gracilibacillus oryzae]|uniref:DUF1456 family protein n=1 Tax=Gracilibacillus oryzae TaxID=1672701 RepID=A0A7C8GSY5_9BACI|nr:DUF1456 family protein [Gracilibacillus oryzae]KAB8134172.1 DUF1456 family protein [Gracilibacillus oryzae]